MPAQPIGLGNLEIKITRAEGPPHGLMERTFSPHVFIYPNTQPAGLGWYKSGLWPCKHFKSHPFHFVFFQPI